MINCENDLTAVERAVFEDDDHRRRLVRVPASSANLGPGYDVMAAAVSLWLELEVEEADEFSLDPGGAELPVGRENLIVRAFESLRPADGIAFRMRSEIPLTRGLGSSAAAIVAGLFAADHLYELGLVEAGAARAGDRARGASGQRRGLDLRRLRDLRRRSKAIRARRASSRPPGSRGSWWSRPRTSRPNRRERRFRRTCPSEDAIANVSAASRLVLGLLEPTSTWSPRASPTSSTRTTAGSSSRVRWRSSAAREIGALGATISGAGPTVLVWTTWQDAGNVAAELERRCGDWAEVRRLPFSPLGADVPEL